MAKTILEGAMEDTKLLKETAIQNAKNVLVEAISPQIKEFVDGVIEGEATYEDEVDMEPESTDEGMYETDLPFAMEAKDEEYEDDDKDDEMSEVVEITNEDLQAALSEMIRSELSEATVSKSFGDVENPNRNADGGVGDSGAPGDTGLADETSGEHHWKESPGAAAPAAQEDWTVAEAAYKSKVKALSNIASRLKKENKEYREACSFLQRNLQEVNLFNSKLLHTNKLIQNTDLSNKQRIGVIEAFDRAGNLREVELVYKSLSESLKIAGVLGESRSPRRTQKVSKSSRYARSGGTSKVLEEQRQNESGVESFAQKMQRLAGTTGLVD